MDRAFGVFLLALGVAFFLVGKRLSARWTFKSRRKKAMILVAQIILAFVTVQCIFIGWFVLLEG